MLFSIIGVKEYKILNEEFSSSNDNEQSYNLEMLLEAKDINQAKDILVSIGVIIISLKNFDEDISAYGNIFLDIEYKNIKIHIFTKIDDLEKATLFFYRAGFNVLNLNYINNPLDKIEIDNILIKSKNIVEKERLEFMYNLKKKESIKKKVYEDAELLEMRENLKIVLERGYHMINKNIGNIDVIKLIKLKDLIGQLSKLRMGTNKVKIKSTALEFLNLMENAEIEFLEKLKKEDGIDEKIGDGSMISNIEIMEEYAKYFNAINTSKIGRESGGEYNKYSIFGKSAIYLSFLFKDIFYRFKNITDVLFNLYDWIEFIIIAVIIEFVFYSILGNIGNEISMSNLWILLNLGVGGFVLYALKFIRRKNSIYLILLLFVIVAMYFVIMNNLSGNFAINTL